MHLSIRPRRFWRPLLALAFVVGVAFVLRSTAHAAALLQAVEPDPGLVEVTDLVSSLMKVVAVALSIVGITGGIKGLVGGIPDLNVGKNPDGSPRFVLKGGLILSWVVGFPVTLVALSQGWGPDLSSYPSGEAAIAGLWAFYSSVSNIVRNAIVGAGGGGTDTVIRELARRGLLSRA
ncbi:MAG: hypothetical protein IT341_07115 [Chloroflexi bacterium]|nr:hypothetical protein [Chloroflexota bacterium]